MNESLAILGQRRSVAAHRLAEPGPNADEVNALLTIAARVPTTAASFPGGSSSSRARHAIASARRSRRHSRPTTRPPTRQAGARARPARAGAPRRRSSPGARPHVKIGLGAASVRRRRLHEPPQRCRLDGVLARPGSPNGMLTTGVSSTLSALSPTRGSPGSCMSDPARKADGSSASRPARHRDEAVDQCSTAPSRTTMVFRTILSGARRAPADRLDHRHELEGRGEPLAVFLLQRRVGSPAYGGVLVGQAEDAVRSSRRRASSCATSRPSTCVRPSTRRRRPCRGARTRMAYAGLAAAPRVS